MQKHTFFLVCLLVILPLTQSQQCYGTCSTCLDNSQSAFACTSCHASSYLYLLSCQPINPMRNQTQQIMYGLFYCFSIVCCVLMFFLICMGQGTYRQAFENLQLIAIFTWQFDTQYGGQPLIIVNWCWIKNGMSGTPTILFLIVFISTFLYMLISLFTYNRLASDSTSMLIKRKRNIFTFRLFHLTFNGLAFASLYQLQDAAHSNNKNVFAFALAIIFIFYFAVSFLMHGVFLNQMKSLDDPYTKVYVENETSKQCASRNHVMISFLLRFILLCLFVFVWSNPMVLMIACPIMQFFYLIYFGFSAKYKKRRYSIINTISNIIMPIQVLIAGFAAIAYNQALFEQFSSLQVAWMSVSFTSLIIMCGILLVQIIANWMKIKRQLRSIYYKYIVCTQVQQQVVLNIYDEAYEKSRVQHFIPNPLHLKKIELSLIADAI